MVLALSCEAFVTPSKFAASGHRTPNRRSTSAQFDDLTHRAKVLRHSDSLEHLRDELASTAR